MKHFLMAGLLVIALAAATQAVPTYRFYRSTQIGTGTQADPFRSALTRCVVGQGNTFWDWVHDARSLRYALVLAEPAVHTTCAADPDITSFSTQLTATELAAWLELPASSLSLAARNQLETDGFSLGWANASTTRRELLRYMSKVHVMMQELKRLRDSNSLQLFNRGLDTTVGALSATVRNALASWVASHGLDTGQVNASTTVRQLIHYVLQNGTWQELNFGSVVI